MKKQGIENQILEQILSFYPYKEENLKIQLQSVEENILLWAIDSPTFGLLYTYSNIKGNLLFQSILFQYATPFSNHCALVKEINGSWYILNTFKQEIVKVPIEDMPWQNIRPLNNGNLALFNLDNQWGSYYFDAEENTFCMDIPFIWDALEFSKNNKVKVGMCNQHIYENSENQKIGTPDFYTFQMKIAELEKEECYKEDAYQQFLQEMYKENKTYQFILRENVLNSLENRIEFKKNAYPLYEKEIPFFNQCSKQIIEEYSLEDYKRVKARVIK